MKDFICFQANTLQIQSRRVLLLVLSGLLLSLCLAFSLSPSQADAASPYDNAIRVSNSLSLISMNGDHNYNAADQDSPYYYMTAIRNSATNRCSAQLKSTLETAIDSGRVSVSQFTPAQFVIDNPDLYGQGNGRAFVFVTWDDTNSEPLTFNGYYNDPPTDHPYLQAAFNTLNTGKQALIYIQNNGAVQVFCNQQTYEISNAPGYDQITNCGYDCNKYLYFTNFPISYPSGYNGIIPPNSPPGTAVPSTETPKIRVITGNEYKITAVDDNFYTIDQPAFLCYDDTAPALHYEIYDRTETEIQLGTGSISSTGQLDWQFPKIERDSFYRIVSYYECPTIPTFSNSAYVDFEIDRFGVFQSTTLSSSWLNSLNIPTYGLQDVVVAPLQFVSDIATTTCTPLTLPMPHGISNITLPCMTPIYQQNFAQILIIYQTILTGLFAYYISIKSFGNIKDMANPRDDQIETIKL